MSKIFSNIWVKCISFLLILAVILGGTLAILNDVLYVSPEERTGRAIKKIYGELVEYTTELDVDNGTDEEIENQYGSISKIYLVGQDVLFKSTGFNGYKNGTISLWIKVTQNEQGHQVIDKVILDSYDKQTLMSKFSNDYYNKFLIDVTDAYEKGTYIFAPKAEDNKLTNPNTGATKSANAACNAVNCVIEYLQGGNA